MKKLKLDLNDLQVESFDALPGKPSGRKGTVVGYEATDEFSTECCTEETVDWGMNCSGEPGCGESVDQFCTGCGSTGNQIDCTCTHGGAGDGTCDASCDTCVPSCDFSCYGMPHC